LFDHDGDYDDQERDVTFQFDFIEFLLFDYITLHFAYSSIPSESHMLLTRLTLSTNLVKNKAKSS